MKFKYIPTVRWSSIDTVSKLAMAMYAMDGYLESLSTIIESASVLELVCIREELLSFINDDTTYGSTCTIKGDKLITSCEICNRKFTFVLNWFDKSYRTNKYFYRSFEFYINGKYSKRTPENPEIPYRVARLLLRAYVLSKVTRSGITDRLDIDYGDYNL